MKRRYKTYIKANLMSIFFIIVSFISGTLAWFAYSGLSDVATEINIRAWNIEIDKKSSTKDITISLSEISPGMETMSEIINIRNSGDSDAIVKFNLVSARILGAEEDNYVVGEDLTTEELQDILANKYPFQINASLSKEYVLKQGGEASLNVSVSWPFDSGNDDLDSTWGTNAYQFLDSEIEKHNSNPSYKIQSPIEIILKLTAEQMTDTQTNVPDSRFDLGKEILYDISTNKLCTNIGNTCIKTYVMDKKNLRSDDIVRLIPDLSSNFGETNFDSYEATLNTLGNNKYKPLLATDLISIISKDIINSVVVRENLSDKIIGYVDYVGRMELQLQQIIDTEGYYQFKNSSFNFLKPNECIWTATEYDEDNGFVLNKENGEKSKISPANKTGSCRIIPVIYAEKKDLITN